MRMLPCTHGSFRIIPRYCGSFVNLAGMPIDSKFAGRYYELSQIFDRVDYFSGVLLGLILGLAFLIAACGIEAGSERLRRILDSLLALSALSVLVVIVWHVLFPPSGGARITDAWIWGTSGSGRWRWWMVPPCCSASDFRGSYGRSCCGPFRSGSSWR